MKLNTSWMTKPINALDGTGWGRTGAAAGAAIGGTYGMFSDDSSMLGGAFKGAIGGALAGRLSRFGSQFLNKRTGDAAKYFENSGVKDLQEVTNNYGGFGGPITKLRATAVGDF